MLKDQNGLVRDKVERERENGLMSILQVKKSKIRVIVTLSFPTGPDHLALILLSLTQLAWDNVSFGVSISVQKRYSFT